MTEEELKNLIEDRNWYGLAVAACQKMMECRKTRPLYAALMFDEGEGVPPTRMVIVDATSVSGAV